jgi:hypothetical protein
LSDAQFSLINKMAAKPDPFAFTNAIQVKIDDNVRMLAELHVRWEREDEIARNMTKVCTITTTSDIVLNASTPSTLIVVEKIPSPCAKLSKTTETFSNKSAEMLGGASLFLLSVFFCFVCCNKWLDPNMFILEKTHSVFIA